MTLAQGAIGSVFHDEEGDIVRYIIFHDAHNMGMLQASNSTGFVTKAALIVICQPHLQHFDSGQCVEIHVLTEIDIGETALPKRAG